MSIKETLKKNDFLRGIVKRIKIYLEFREDARDFSKYYLEEAEKKGDYRYRLMLLIHNIEKGMSRSDPRPFGKDKATKIVEILRTYHETNRPIFEYDLSCATLVKWRDFYLDRGWNFEGVAPETISFIESINLNNADAGYMIYERPEKAVQSQIFEDVLFSRRSVRDFDHKELSEDDVEFAIRCFIEAPTACNRQMCKVYQIRSVKAKELLARTILGVGGFNIDTVTFFLFTYDISAFEFYGERNQGYVNVGLTAMNFANGLHSRGIGSCFMQWSNKREDDKKVRQELGLGPSERIGLVIGAGYYKDKSVIPCSRRKEISDIYGII